MMGFGNPYDRNLMLIENVEELVSDILFSNGTPTGETTINSIIEEIGKIDEGIKLLSRYQRNMNGYWLLKCYVCSLEPRFVRDLERKPPVAIISDEATLAKVKEFKYLKGTGLGKKRINTLSLEILADPLFSGFTLRSVLLSTGECFDYGLQ